MTKSVTWLQNSPIMFKNISCGFFFHMDILQQNVPANDLPGKLLNTCNPPIILLLKIHNYIPLLL
jgi:hypothetical protein